ncbi:MAG: PC4/YdbC family ssDNA-binding protein, partial [Anaerolineales bacterium]
DKYEELAQAIKSLENVMSNEKLVAKIKKNSKEEIRIALNVYKGVPLIQIRTYAAYGRDTELIATKKGLAINVNLLPLLIESIEKLSSTVNLLK